MARDSENLSVRENEMKTKIYVSISGGCYQHVKNVPKGYEIDVIDWDNLLSEDDSLEEWNRFDSEAKQFIKDNYPMEYELIRKNLQPRMPITN
jgi:hypothetical protein